MEEVDSLNSQIQELLGQLRKWREAGGPSGAQCPTSQRRNTTYPGMGMSRGASKGGLEVVAPDYTGPKRSTDEKENDGWETIESSMYLPKELKLCWSHGESANCASFSNSGRKLATCGSGGTVRIWPADGGTEQCCLSGAKAALISCEWSNDDGLLVGVGNDQKVRIWKMSTETLKLTLTGHSNKVYSAHFSWDNARCLSGSLDRTIRIWDVEVGYQDFMISTKSSVNYCHLHPNSNEAATACMDSNICFWDLKSKRMTWQFKKHESQATGVRFSLDGSTVVTTSKDGRCYVIDVRTRKVLGNLSQDGYRNSHSWFNATFSPDGKYVVGGSTIPNRRRQYGIYVWNTRTCKHEKTLFEHKGSITCAHWQGAGVVSTDIEGNIILWRD